MPALAIGCIKSGDRLAQGGGLRQIVALLTLSPLRVTVHFKFLDLFFFHGVIPAKAGISLP
jgi:hypothetical protein